jgi:hypothetical protein
MGVERDTGGDYEHERGSPREPFRDPQGPELSDTCGIVESLVSGTPQVFNSALHAVENQRVIQILTGWGSGQIRGRGHGKPARFMATISLAASSREA